MFHTELTPPSINQAAIDHYVAKGKQVRSRAVLDMVSALFKRSDSHAPAQAACQA